MLSDGVALLWGLRVPLGICFLVNWFVFAVHGAPRRSEKFYDLTGSITYCSATLASVATSPLALLGPTRASLVSLAVLCWCSRLGSFLFTRIKRDGEDRRMRKIKSSIPVFFVAWNIQAIWCFTVALPAYVLLLRSPEGPQDPLNVIDAVGLTTWAAGWGLELLADSQKYAFRNDPANKNKFISSGVWAWSRHPNYFGEITLWCGLAITASNGLRGFDAVAVFASPVFTAFLLIFVSGVPLLESYANKKWGNDPEYQRYVKTTSILMPWPPSASANNKKI